MSISPSKHDHPSMFSQAVYASSITSQKQQIKDILKQRYIKKFKRNINLQERALKLIEEKLSTDVSSKQVEEVQKAIQDIQNAKSKPNQSQNQSPQKILQQLLQAQQQDSQTHQNQKPILKDNIDMVPLEQQKIISKTSQHILKGQMLQQNQTQDEHITRLPRINSKKNILQEYNQINPSYSNNNNVTFENKNNINNCIDNKSQVFDEKGQKNPLSSPGPFSQKQFGNQLSLSQLQQVQEISTDPHRQEQKLQVQNNNNNNNNIFKQVMTLNNSIDNIHNSNMNREFQQSKIKQLLPEQEQQFYDLNNQTQVSTSMKLLRNAPDRRSYHMLQNSSTHNNIFSQDQNNKVHPFYSQSKLKNIQQQQQSQQLQQYQQYQIGQSLMKLKRANISQKPEHNVKRMINDAHEVYIFDDKDKDPWGQVVKYKDQLDLKDIELKKQRKKEQQRELQEELRQQIEIKKLKDQNEKVQEHLQGVKISQKVKQDYQQEIEENYKMGNEKKQTQKNQITSRLEEEFRIRNLKRREDMLKDQEMEEFRKQEIMKLDMKDLKRKQEQIQTADMVRKQIEDKKRIRAFTQSTNQDIVDASLSKYGQIEKEIHQMSDLGNHQENYFDNSYQEQIKYQQSKKQKQDEVREYIRKQKNDRSKSKEGEKDTYLRENVAKLSLLDNLALNEVKRQKKNNILQQDMQNYQQSQIETHQKKYGIKSEMMLHEQLQNQDLIRRMGLERDYRMVTME